MPLAPVVATQLTTPETRAFGVFIAGRDVTILVPVDKLVSEAAGSNVRTTLNLEVWDRLADHPEISGQAMLRIVDHAANLEVFRGPIVSHHPTTGKLSVIGIVAEDIGALLGSTYIVSEVRPAESMQARIGYLWGVYAGSHLSGDLSYVDVIGGTLPAQDFAGVSLAQAISSTISQASSSADYFVDMLGKLHVTATATNPAPYNVVVGTPAAGQIAPEGLDIDYEAKSYANRVYVQGATPAGSGYFSATAAIDAANGLIRTAVIQASDSETQAMAQSLANMYLGRVAGSVTRGRFGASTPNDGWAPGQVVAVTEPDIGLSAVDFTVARVTTHYSVGRTALQRSYDIEFGRTQAVGQGILNESLGVGQIVSGQLGGASNVYVTSDGVAVTDGTNVRAQLGKLGVTAGQYGLRVVSSDGATVIIDGTSDMFRISASGSTSNTLGVGPSSGWTDTTLAGTLTTTPAHLSFVSTTNTVLGERFIGERRQHYAGWVAATSGAATTIQANTPMTYMDVTTSLISAQCMVRFGGYNYDNVAKTWYAKYYVLSQVAL